MKLKVVVKSDNHRKGEQAMYANEINGRNFKDVSLVLNDLNNFGVPIEKALKEFKIKKSDWDIALRL